MSRSDTTRGMRLGTVHVNRVTEWAGRLFDRRQLLPESTRAQWVVHGNWLVPEFWDPATDAIIAALQTYVVRTGDRTILVDTGIGNDKHRPSTPPLNELDGPFLHRLRDVGVHPDDVDTVVCTHLHPDHVGWNTRCDGGRWVPTFPNARYLLPAADYAMLQGLPAHSDHVNNLDALADSVQPIVDAGQAEMWEGDEVDLAEGVRLLAAPGHSPGSSVVTVECDSRTAILSGDIVHHPMQILQPEQVTAFDALLPYFKRTETAVHGEPRLRGQTGPLRVAPAEPPSPLHEALLEAAVQSGHSRARDVSGGLEVGFGPVDLNVVDGLRQSVADAYLGPAMHRHNLDVLSGTVVDRVLVEGKRARVCSSARRTARLSP